MTDVNSFLHAMPEAAQEDIQRMGVQSQQIGDGVDRLMMSGHDRGVPYRFEILPYYNKAKSDELGYEFHDEIKIIKWLKDRKRQPIALVSSLPEELLRFNREGVCVGGRYKEAYIRWIEGKQAVGLALAKWGVLSDGEVASLEADQIYTVEQFSELPRERIAGKYPQQFIDAYDRARQWVAGKDMRAVAEKQSSETQRLQQENRDLAERLAKLEALLEEKTEPKKVVNKLVEKGK